MSILPFVSGLLSVLAVINSLRTLYLKKTGARVQGEVIEIDASTEGDTPIIGFKARDGKDYRFRVKTILGKENWSLGTVWPIIYRIHNPKHAQVDRFAQLWGQTLLYGGLAVGVGALFLILRFVS